jgi:hypothetical protein
MLLRYTFALITFFLNFPTQYALTGGQCRVAPQTALKTWGVPGGTDLHFFITKLIGQSGLALSAILYTLGVEGGSAATAVGRAAAVYLASIVEFLASGTFEDIGVDASKCYPWIALSAVAAGTLLL